MQLYIGDHYGVYIPQMFARYTDRDRVKNIDPQDWEIIKAGPDHDLYWEAWDCIEQQAEVHCDNGKVYTLWQNGDLWLIERGEEIPADFRW